MRSVLQIISWFFLSLLNMAVVAYGALVYFDSGSWVIIFAFLTGWSFFTSIWFKRAFLRLSFFNLTAIFLGLMIGEAYLEYTFKYVVIQGDVVQEGDCNGPNFFNPDDLLGYAPPEIGDFSCLKRAADNETIFDVIYSFENGKRVIPNSDFSSEKQALFLGCSFTFGEGLPAEETLSYLFNDISGMKYDIQNRGFSGYGPHQMLAMLQFRDLELLASTDVSHKAIYTFIPDHIRRAAGKTPWVRVGPRYEMEDNRIVYKGSFNFQSTEYKGTSANLRRIKTALFKSKLFYQVFIFRDVTQKDIDRTIGIISESASLLEASGYRFYMLVWDIHHLDYVFKGNQFEYFVDELTKRNIRMVFASDVIHPKEINRYTIHPKDAHPNRLANEVLANALLNATSLHSSNELVVGKE